MAVIQHGFTRKSKGQGHMVTTYENHHSRMAASEVCCCCCRAWDAHIVWWLRFL